MAYHRRIIEGKVFASSHVVESEQIIAGECSEGSHLLHTPGGQQWNTSGNGAPVQPIGLAHKHVTLLADQKAAMLVTGSFFLPLRNGTKLGLANFFLLANHIVTLSLPPLPRCLPYTSTDVITLVDLPRSV